MRNYSLITIVILGVIMYAPPSTKAGPIKMLNEQAKFKHLAEVEKAANAEASVTFAQIRDDIADVGTALDAVEAAIDAIDMSTIDPAAFTGAQKTCIQNLKGNLNSLKVATKSLKVAAKNNMQASMKLVKKMKETQDIEEKYTKRLRRGD